MNTILTRRLTAATMAGAAILASAGFAALGSIFNYPKILRSPAADILAAGLAAAVHTAWMSQPCCSSCMNGTFTSYAAVLMMPAGQATQQPRTIRRSWVIS